ncbi:hypothetical protein ACWD2L_00500 [Streptomyces sp. NPDC002754]
MAIDMVTLAGRYVDLDGDPCEGTVTFTPPCLVRDNYGHVILSGSITAELDNLGRLLVQLPCTEQDDLSPSGFCYHVTERLQCSDCIEEYDIRLDCTGRDPEPSAAVECLDDGYSVRLVVPVTATFPVTVDWGDGSEREVFDRDDTIPHTFNESGASHITVVDADAHALPLDGPDRIPCTDAATTASDTATKAASAVDISTLMPQPCSDEVTERGADRG